MEKIIYTKFSSERKKEFAIQTSIVEIDGVKYSRKKAMYPEAKIHIKRIVENCDVLTKIYGKKHVAQCVKVSDDEVYTEFIEGITLSKKIEESILSNNINLFYNYVDEYITFIKKSCLSNNNSIEMFEISQLDSKKRCSNIDMIFDNIIVENNNWIIIDYEWLVPKIDYRFVLYRTINILLERNKIRYEDIIYDIREKYIIQPDPNYIKWTNVFGEFIFDNYIQRYTKSISQNVHKSTIYVLTNGQYNENNTIVHTTEMINESIKIKANIKGLIKENRIRIDPLEGEFCSCEIISIDTDAENYYITPFNAYLIDGDKYTFFTIDPIIEIIGDFSNATYITIIYKLNVLFSSEIENMANKLHNQVVQVKEKLKEAIIERDNLICEIHNIKSTNGYKLLEKIRKFIK